MPEPILKEYADGGEFWYLNDLLHREDGPAVELPDGSYAWYLNGQFHRPDGPAVELPSGYKEWWLNDKRYTEEEYVMIQFMKGKNIYV